MILTTKYMKFIACFIIFNVLILISGCGDDYPNADEYENAAKFYFEANLKYDYSNPNNIHFVGTPDTIEIINKDEQKQEYNQLKDTLKHYFYLYLTDEQIDRIIQKHFQVQKEAKYNISSEAENEKNRLIHIKFEQLDGEKNANRFFSSILDKLNKATNSNFYTQFNQSNSNDFPRIFLIATGKFNFPNAPAIKLTNEQIGKIIEDSFMEIYNAPDKKEVDLEMLLLVKDNYDDTKIIYYDISGKILDLPILFWDNFYGNLSPDK